MRSEKPHSNAKAAPVSFLVFPQKTEVTLLKGASCPSTEGVRARLAGRQRCQPGQVQSCLVGLLSFLGPPQGTASEGTLESARDP